MSYRRRRRIEYTPEQIEARTKLESAELWALILEKGIAAVMERNEYGCADSIRQIITRVNTDLARAATDLEIAREAHDKAFNRGSHRVIIARSRPNPKKTAAPGPPTKKAKKA